MGKKIVLFLVLTAGLLGLMIWIATILPSTTRPATAGNNPSYLSQYERCIVDSIDATARRFQKEDRSYYTVTADQVIAMARRNAELECADRRTDVVDGWEAARDEANCDSMRRNKEGVWEFTKSAEEREACKGNTEIKTE